MSQIGKDHQGGAGGPVVGRRRNGYPAISWGLLLPIISMCFLLSGCVDVTTIWSTEARSPDGLWVATAQTDQHSGPGNAFLETMVLLKRTSGRNEPTQILLLGHQDTRSIGLKMNWLGFSHLEVTYTHPAEVYFQAIKCAGIEISLRDLWGEI